MRMPRTAVLTPTCSHPQTNSPTVRTFAEQGWAHMRRNQPALSCRSDTRGVSTSQRSGDCDFVQTAHTASPDSLRSYRNEDNRMKKSILLLALLLVSACGGSPAAPTESAINVSGTWVETGSTFRTTLAQSGTSITGAWSVAAISGTVSGFSSGKNVNLTLTPSNPRDCGIAYTGTLVSANRIDGTAATTNCTVSSGGASTLTRQ
jgi:hypothetical protein